MPRSALVLLVGLGLVLSGCGADGSADEAPGASRPALSGTINVFAAASLKETFTALGAQFEQANPGTKVVFNFGPSSGLATQITNGAPADVFASASTKNMDAVVTAGEAVDAVPFARNTMGIAVPPKNPGGITALADLATKGVKVAVCQAAAPCGATAAKVFSNAGLEVTPVTEEVDVKAVLSKVTLGEVDAGLVYVTDLKAAGAKVTAIAVPDALNASTTYPLATLKDSGNAATAKAFVDLVLSRAGVSVLTAAGFTAP